MPCITKTSNEVEILALHKTGLHRQNCGEPLISSHNTNCIPCHELKPGTRVETHFLFLHFVSIFVLLVPAYLETNTFTFFP